MLHLLGKKNTDYFLGYDVLTQWYRIITMEREHHRFKSIVFKKKKKKKKICVWMSLISLTYI